MSMEQHKNYDPHLLGREPESMQIEQSSTIRRAVRHLRSFADTRDRQSLPQLAKSLRELADELELLDGASWSKRLDDDTAGLWDGSAYVVDAEQEEYMRPESALERQQWLDDLQWDLRNETKDGQL